MKKFMYTGFLAMAALVGFSANALENDKQAEQICQRLEQQQDTNVGRIRNDGSSLPGASGGDTHRAPSGQ